MLCCADPSLRSATRRAGGLSRGRSFAVLRMTAFSPHPGWRPFHLRCPPEGAARRIFRARRPDPSRRRSIAVLGDKEGGRAFAGKILRCAQRQALRKTVSSAAPPARNRKNDAGSRAFRMRRPKDGPNANAMGRVVFGSSACAALRFDGLPSRSFPGFRVPALTPTHRASRARRAPAPAASRRSRPSCNRVYAAGGADTPGIFASTVIQRTTICGCART